jgi:hypothetical protein
MGKGGLLHSYRLSLRLLSVSPRCGLPGRSIVVCMHCCAVHNNCPVTLCTGPYFYTGGSDRLKLKDRSQTVLWCWTYNNLLQYEYLTYPAPLPPSGAPLSLIFPISHFILPSCFSFGSLCNSNNNRGKIKKNRHTKKKPMYEKKRINDPVKGSQCLSTTEATTHRCRWYSFWVNKRKTVYFSMHEKSLSKISIVYYFQNPELSPKRKSTGRYSSAMGLDRIWGISLSLSIISCEKKKL